MLGLKRQYLRTFLITFNVNVTRLCGITDVIKSNWQLIDVQWNHASLYSDLSLTILAILDIAISYMHMFICRVC